ncbi:hypothetical protein DMB66_07245 [Actinoplanes sp. ATCC 53533]|uniref:hypothetical protein n=1 Tax=Actinoplanes sp. ATCC 53533 TaxID=1288362 RepID=UPI000F7B1B4F|nr:hypothetical protein [Actinoplanes sp. ATCC 53533]RSM71634.1 hypothetical protein DMB66_07245 [Actinoplanes sp. ATCC 53533]
MTQRSAPAQGGRAHYLSPRWLLGHIVVCGLFLLFIRLGWWQLRSAMSGHVLSIGYALQWPVFAGFGVFVWVRAIRQHAAEQAATPSAGKPLPAANTSMNWTFSRDSPPPTPSRPAQGMPADDPELMHYNEMLEWLRADPRRHPRGFRSRPTAVPKKRNP